LIARFESEGLFAEQSLRQPNFGPDANYTTILVRHDGRELKLESWHELFERDGKLAASSRGVEALNGRRVGDVLQADTTEYQRFRQVWDELRRDARSLVPAEMEPTTGLLHAENSELSWMDLTSLVEALEMIHAIGPWRIQPYLQAAVMLQGLTDQERIGMLRDWAGAHRDEQVIILCRMLFERAEGGEFRAPMLGAPSYLADTTAEDWPLEPIALVRDMPVLITPGYTLGGHAEPAGNYLDYCLELCHWSQRRFEVLDTTEIQQRLEELIAGDHWKRPLTDYEIRFLRSQAEPIPDYDTFVSLGVIDPEWAEHVTRLLDQNGIPNVVEGSVMYGVSVAPADAERALGILAADVRRNKYQATLLSLQQVREAAPPQEPVDQGAASSAAQLSAEVRQVLDGLQVGMDEADAVRHLKPVALDHGTTYFGGSGAKVLYYQLTLESQIGIRIGGSADPATFGKVVEIGRVEPKTIWRRFEGDSIVFHQWNHIVNQRVALVGRIRSADKPLRPWMLTTIDGTVYVPGGPELAGVEQNARVIVKGVLRHEPGVRAPEGVAETPQAAPLPEYFYFDDDPPPEIRAGGWTLDELRPFLIAGVQYSTLVNQVGEEDLNPGRAVLRPVYFLGGKDSGRRLYLEFDNDRLRAAQVRDAESNELIEQLRLQDE
jgi:hypothetical protein